MKIVDRYITREFFVFFCAVIMGFVVLMTGNTLFIMSDLVMSKRIPFFIVSQILLLRIPALLVLGFPVATIFAIMMTMGRLAKDSELIAIRTGGVSYPRIILPLLIISSTISISSFCLNEMVVPRANNISQNYIRQFTVSEVMENASANVFFKMPGGLVLYTGQYNEENKGMQKVMLFETDEYSFPSISDVSNGNFDSDFLNLNDGITYKINQDGLIDKVVRFKSFHQDISREMNKMFFNTKTMQEVFANEALEIIKSLEKHGINVSAQKTDYYFKYSIPVACLAFAVVGLLFVTSNPRMESFSGIIIALILVASYWIMMTILRSMGHKSIVAPWLAAWGSNLACFMIGFPLLFSLRKN